MEKTKRLSKSSIAVIVLAVLLALSLVMGLTGAWFTDQDHTAENQVLKFGLVDVDINRDAQTGKAITFDTNDDARGFNRLLPGDEITASGSVISNSDVKTYVFITADAYLRVNTGTAQDPVYKTVKVYNVAGTEGNYSKGSTNLMQVGAVTVVIPEAASGKTAQWAEETGDAGENLVGLYVVEEFTNAEGDTPQQTVTFSSTVELLGAEFLNHVWLQEQEKSNGAWVDKAGEGTGNRVLLNGDQLGNYELYVELTIRAVQFDNIEGITGENAKSAAKVAWELLQNDVEVMDRV